MKFGAKRDLLLAQLGFFRAKFHSKSLYSVEKKIVGISQYAYFSGSEKKLCTKHLGCHHVRVFSDPPKSVSELVTYVPSTLSSRSDDCCHVLSVSLMFPLCFPYVSLM
jgi:hypothetical protein